MEAKQYIEKLNELAYKFRDDDEVCNSVCSKCALNEKISITQKCEKSYCYILISILNASAEYDEM